jgi:large subunit ribosomal protein L9
MKVILLNHIENLGKKGDVVSVKRGYARNYLVPRNLALFATPQNLKHLSSIQAQAAEEEEKVLAELKKLDDKIRSLSLTFIRKVDENEHMFGSVSETDIINQLADKDVEIQKSMIMLDKHIKTLGETVVPIRLHRDLVSELKVMVEKEAKEVPVEEDETETPEKVEEESPAEPEPVPEEDITEDEI